MKLYTNELRYGSWIDYLGTHVQCDISTIYAYSKVVGETEIYKPIPVTRDVLLKCGFQVSKQKDTVTDQLTNIVWINCDDIQLSFIYGMTTLNMRNVSNPQQLSLPIKAKPYGLHQLQNLFFALTGTELNYTP